MGDALALRTADLRATAEAASRILDVGPLQSSEDATQAAAMLRALHEVRSEAEDARKAAKAPHLAAGRAVDAQFQAPRKELERVMGLLKRRLGERALAADAARTQALTAPPEKANALLATMENEDHERITERWSWEVESADLAKVPVLYLSLDLGMVQSAIKAATREAREPKIPGVVFKRIVKVNARRAIRKAI